MKSVNIVVILDFFYPVETICKGIALYKKKKVRKYSSLVFITANTQCFHEVSPVCVTVCLSKYILKFSRQLEEIQLFTLQK